MVDKATAAAKIAAIRDAVERIRLRTSADLDHFVRDRDARDIVAMNLLVALQEALALAAHWLADEGRQVPQTYREVVLALADAGVVSRPLADRLASAAGLRNLIAHRYAAVDWRRVHAIARESVQDLEQFCAELAEALSRGR